MIMIFALEEEVDSIIRIEHPGRKDTLLTCLEHAAFICLLTIAEKERILLGLS